MKTIKIDNPPTSLTNYKILRAIEQHMISIIFSGIDDNTEGEGLYTDTLGNTTLPSKTIRL